MNGCCCGFSSCAGIDYGSHCQTLRKRKDQPALNPQLLSNDQAGADDAPCHSFIKKYIYIYKKTTSGLERLLAARSIGSSDEDADLFSSGH